MLTFAEGDLVRCSGGCVQGSAHFTFALGRESEVVLFCVYVLPQKLLFCGPGTVSLPKLLCRDRLITEAVDFYVRSEDFFDAPKNVEEYQ